MITRTFRAGEDQELGGYGWIPTWIPGANAGDGRLAAHDVLEHYADTQGGAEGELLAMGCVIWGRVMSGSIHSDYLPVEKIIGSDIMQVLREVLYGNQTLTDPGRTARIFDDEGVEQMINDCIPQALKSLRIETEGDDQNINQALGMTDAEISYRIRGWLRKGARAANNKYYKRHGVGNGQLAMLFDKVQAKISRYDAQDYLGATMKVRVNLAKYEVDIEVKSPYDEDYFD